MNPPASRTTGGTTIAGDSHRFHEPADPPLLDVDDAAGAEGDGRGRVGQAVDGLVQADRGPHLLLEERVFVDVAVG